MLYRSSFFFFFLPSVSFSWSPSFLLFSSVIFFLTSFLFTQCFRMIWPEKEVKQQKRRHSFSVLSHYLTTSFLFQFLFHCQSDTYAIVARFKLFFFFSRKHKKDYACMSHDWALSVIYGHSLFSFEWLCCYVLDCNMRLIFPFHVERWRIIILIFFFY